MDSPFALDLQQVDLTRVSASEPGAPAAFAAMWALPLMRHAQPVSLEVLGRAAQLVRLSKGHTIFRRGDLPNGLYYVVSGSVKLLAQAAGGRDKVIDIFGDGQLFGEIGLFMDGPYRSWAQTIGRCVLLYLPKTAVIEAIGNDLGLALHFLHEVSSRAQILIDALTAIQAGQAAVGVPGWAAFKDEWTRDFRGKDVILVMDADDAGRKGTLDIVRRFQRAGLPAPRQMKLAEGMDLNDFYLAHKGTI